MEKQTLMLDGKNGVDIRVRVHGEWEKGTATSRTVTVHQLRAAPLTAAVVVIIITIMITMTIIIM